MLRGHTALLLNRGGALLLWLDSLLLIRDVAALLICGNTTLRLNNGWAALLVHWSATTLLVGGHTALRLHDGWAALLTHGRPRRAALLYPRGAALFRSVAMLLGGHGGANFGSMLLLPSHGWRRCRNGASCGNRPGRNDFCRTAMIGSKELLLILLRGLGDLTLLGKSGCMRFVQRGHL